MIESSHHPDPAPTPDRELLQRVALGDKEAFGELYNRHRLSLYALAYGIVMNTADADVVVRNVFDEISRMASRLDPSDVSVHSWLADATRNRAHGVLQARE